MSDQSSVLQVQNLCKYFPVGAAGFSWGPKNQVHAVDDVSFELEQAEVLALVGESGCGKSTLVLTLLGLEKATVGKIIFEGQDVTHLNSAGLKLMRRHIQMIF